MTFKIYYDDIDGEMHPKWVLLPSKPIEDNIITYNVAGPFERFFQEDFYDELRLISVTQGALTSYPFDQFKFSIDIRQLKVDLDKQGIPGEAINETNYFIVLVDDLEELLQFNVRRFFNENN